MIYKNDICGIYKITNKINGNAYIGQSIHIYQRFDQHRVKSQSNNDSDYSIYNAMRKYGLDNFSYEIIEKCDKDILDEREIYWIEYYDTFYNGYNETKGGQGCSGTCSLAVEQYDLKGNFIAEYESIIEAAMATGATSISKVCKGKGLTAKGFQWFYKGQANPKDLSDYSREDWVPVYQYDLDGNFIRTFDTISEAERFYDKYKKANITKVCNGNAKVSLGYQWRYLEDNKDFTSPIGKVEFNTSAKYNKIAQCDRKSHEIISIFNSVKEASSLTATDKSCIYSVINGRRQSAGGYYWKEI